MKYETKSAIAYTHTMMFIATLFMCSVIVVATKSFIDSTITAHGAPPTGDTERFVVSTNEINHSNALLVLEEHVELLENNVVRLNNNIEFYTNQLAKMNAALERIEVCKVHKKTVMMP